MIIGGGSAGFNCALEAKKLGLSVAMVNYVRPTDLGTKWGLGGTCLNVGCIPKYFYHLAAQQRRDRNLRRVMGINTPLTYVDWGRLSDSVQNYIQAESHKLGTLLKDNNIKHFNKVGYLIDSNRVALLEDWGEVEHSISTNFEGDLQLEADYFLICTGERPLTELASIPGLNFALTSDELFKIKSRPKSALVLGNGYVAMEVVSLMQGLGVNTKLYHRSKILSTFDEEMKNELLSNLRAEGAELREDLVSLEIQHTKEKISEINSGKSGNKIHLDGEYATKATFVGGETLSEKFDLVINALARKTDLRFLDALGGKLNINERQRLVGGHDNMMEKTSIKNIFAAGDCLENSPRNEPGAAIGGRRVAQYIKAEMDNDVAKMTELASFKFRNTPYCLFTSPEISGVGLTEHQAKAAYPHDQFKSIRLKKTSYLEKIIGLNPLAQELDLNGQNNTHFKTEKEVEKIQSAEGIKSERAQETEIRSNYLKILYETKSGDDRIIGMHYLGDSAANIIQGYSVSFSQGLHLRDLQNCCYIHPCEAEDFVKLAVINSDATETPC